MRYALLLLFAAAIRAEEPFVCGTSAKNDAVVETRGHWFDMRDSFRAAKGRVPSAEAYAKNNVIVLPADDSTAPFRKPFDLIGKSLTFMRNGDDSFSESTGALVYDDVLGVQLTTDLATHSTSYTLAQFDFPFLGRTARKLYISQLHAIYLDPPPPVPVSSFKQYNDAEALAQKQPVIAPLLTTGGGLAARYPNIYVKDAADRVTITWSQASSSEAIQAVLFANGDIRFAYRNIGPTRAGALVITSGGEAWRAPVEIAGVTDREGDISPSFSAMLAPMLDITKATVSRLGNTNLLQVAIKLRGAFDRSQIGAGNYAVYQVQIGELFTGYQYLVAYFSGSGSGSDVFSVPSWGSSEPSPAMRVDGDTITLTVAQEQWLAAGTTDSDLVVATFWKNFADSASVRAKIDAPQQQARTSFGGITSNTVMPGPIEESFTLPILNPSAVWSSVRSAFGVDPKVIDGLAIYQNFYTDLILYAGAYSTGGNPGVDNIVRGTRSSSTKDRSPALLHMNTIRYSSNSEEKRAAFVLMHELGHRWLHLVNIIDENGINTGVLNPLTAHPAQYVDTRAAFNVYTSSDASVMGGATFTDNHDGTFRTPAEAFAWSYSWLDLYLMGLAAPEEVQPFFYLTSSSPALGQEYNPPANVTYTATRNDVALSNVTNAMGVRKPAYPNTQRAMRLLFVLISDPTQSVSDADVNEVAKYARSLGVAFAAATNNRASIASTFATAPAQKRRAVGH